MTNETLAQQLKFPRRPGLLSRWDELLHTAAQATLSHARFLTRVIEEEYRLKCEAARQQRLKLAKIPEPWVMDTFPFERQPKLNKKKTLALYDSMAFLRDKQNILWLGRTGCGKTGLATSFLIQAIHQGARGRYVLFTDLLHELDRSQADRSQNQVIRRYANYDLLLIDEMGYAEAEPSEVGLFFTLLQKRHKQRSTLITSNLGFSEWASFLKNPHLTTALIDRLTESSHVFNMRECVTLRSPMAPDP
ncbi:MAG: ATP-binding protein [Verrucomicrobia bacterium]|nr:ATP-binding protein [Verrucomicrobiota bacterium]